MYPQLDVQSMAIAADRWTLSARAERGWIVAQAATGFPAPFSSPYL